MTHTQIFSQQPCQNRVSVWDEVSLLLFLALQVKQNNKKCQLMWKKMIFDITQISVIRGENMLANSLMSHDKQVL